MKLEEYYRLEELNRFNTLNKENELKSLRDDIKSFFDGFNQAYQIDLKFEQVVTAEYLEKAYTSNAYLSKNIEKLKGLALYLQDFQGTHDLFMKKSKFQLKAFAYIVLKFDHPFEGYRHRLLDFLDAPEYFACLAVHRDEIANFCITNFDTICDDKLLMERLLAELNKMKKRIESASEHYTFSSFMSHYILYKLIKQKLSYFKKF